MRKNYWKLSLIALSLALFMPFTVNAKVVEAADNVTIKEEANSSKFAVANEIKNTAKIDGIFIATGNSIANEGNISYGAIAGNDISVEGTVEKDLFIAGNSVNLKKDAIITRDVFIAANIVNIDTNIGHNIRIAAANVDLSDVTINGSATIYADKITFNENTKINGSLTYYKDTSVEGLNEKNVGKINVKEVKTPSKKEQIKATVLDSLTTIASRFISLLLILIIFAKIPKKLNEEKISVETVGYSLLKGFGTLIIVPFIALVFIFSSIFTPLSLILLALYVVALYLSNLVTSYIVGSSILKVLKKKPNLYLEALIGVALIEILGYIPIIGALIAIASVLFGLGVIYNLIRSLIKK